MNSIEDFRRFILKNQKCNPAGSVRYPWVTLAAKSGLIIRHVKEVLDEMEAQQLITKTASGVDVDVTVTARGAELVSELPASTIGFKAS